MDLLNIILTVRRHCSICLLCRVIHRVYLFSNVYVNIFVFGSWRLLAPLGQSWSSWRRGAMMWLCQMMQVVLYAIMSTITLFGSPSRMATNLYLSMFLSSQELMKKPRCNLQLPFWRLLHQHVNIVDLYDYLNVHACQSSAAAFIWTISIKL